MDRPSGPARGRAPARPRSCRQLLNTRYSQPETSSVETHLCARTGRRMRWAIRPRTRRRPRILSNGLLE